MPDPIEVVAANVLSGKIKIDDVPAFRRRSVMNIIRIAPPESIKTMAENRLKNREDERLKTSNGDKFVRTIFQPKLSR